MGDIAKAISTAIEAAKKVPEEFRIVTYQEVLRHELVASDSEEQHSVSAERKPRRPTRVNRSEIRLPEAHLVADSGDRSIQIVWAVISLRTEGVEADNEAIRNKIELSLGTKPENRQNTNRTLGGLVPKYLTRHEKEIGRGYAFEPAARAIEIFEGLEKRADG